MSQLSNNEKVKDKKKSFVERFFNFASHTIRINKKAESNNQKKAKKISARNALNNVVSKSLVQLDIQTCTFCDYCDEKIVANFTGQNIICHDSCKLKHEQEFPIEPNLDLERSLDSQSSIKSAILQVPKCTVNTSHSILGKRLSTSLFDLTNGDDYSPAVTRRVRERSVEAYSRANCLLDSDTGSYTFSTVDLSTIKQYGISIKKVPSLVYNSPGIVDNCDRVEQIQGRMNRESSVSVDYSTMSSDQLVRVMDIFNNNDQGLFIEHKNGQIKGKIRVFMNLLRPIKMLLTARPPSMFDILPESIASAGDQSTMDRAYYNKEVIFWLPRGTTKLMYIDINCPTSEVISLLLAKFNIQNNPKKFALYQHFVKSPKEVEVCKLKPSQCPLKITTDWCAKGAEYFQKNLETRRFVLQENDPGSIDWDEFSVPELKSFLMILEQEEEEKKTQIKRKYEILRNNIHRLMVAR